MEPVGIVFDKLKAVAKTGQDFFDGLFPRRRNPVPLLSFAPFAFRSPSS